MNYNKYVYERENMGSVEGRGIRRSRGNSSLLDKRMLGRYNKLFRFFRIGVKSFNIHHYRHALPDADFVIKLPIPVLD
jgi:hypothetical protein